MRCKTGGGVPCVRQEAESDNPIEAIGIAMKLHAEHPDWAIEVRDEDGYLILTDESIVGRTEVKWKR